MNISAVLKDDSKVLHPSQQLSKGEIQVEEN